MANPENKKIQTRPNTTESLDKASPGKPDFKKQPLVSDEINTELEDADAASQ